MPREIKFRSWVTDDEDEEKFHMTDPVDALEMCLGGMDIIALMQFTGLKDKNGVEIYEGDIISRTSPYEHSRKVEVRWDESMSMWNAYLGNVSQGGLWKNIKGEEVIGNIYQNPELLK